MANSYITYLPEFLSSIHQKRAELPCWWGWVWGCWLGPPPSSQAAVAVASGRVTRSFLFQATEFLNQSSKWPRAAQQPRKDSPSPLSGAWTALDHLVIHSPPAFLLSELHPSRASQAPPPSRKLPQTPGAILPPSYFSSGPFSTPEHWRYRDLSAESTNAPDRTPHGGGTGGQPRTSTVGPAPPLDFRLWEALKGFDLWKGPFHHTISPFTMRKHHCTIGSSSKMNLNTYRRQRGGSASMGQIIISTVAFLFRKLAHPMRLHWLLPTLG